LGGVEYFFFFFSFTCRTAHAHALLAFSVLSIDIKRVYNTARLLLLVADCWYVWGGVCVDIYISLHRPYRENSERRPETDGMGLKGGIEREGERRITQSLMKSQESRARNVQQTRQFVSCENRADGREFCRLSLNHIFCPFCPGFTLLEPSQLVKSCFFLFSHSFHRWIK
jgi:hypothetical protein